MTNIDDDEEGHSSRSGGENSQASRSLKKESRSDSAMNFSSREKPNLRKLALTNGKDGSGGDQGIDALAGSHKRNGGTTGSKPEAVSSNRVEKAKPVRRASEGSLLVPKEKKEVAGGSPQLPEKKVSTGKMADGSSTSPGKHALVKRTKLTAEMRGKSDSNILRAAGSSGASADGLSRRNPAASDVSGVSKHPNDATAEKSSAKRKVSRPAPVAQPISSRPSHALKRMEEQKKLEEEKKKKKERERAEAEKERAREKAAEELAKSQTDGENIEGREEPQEEGDSEERELDQSPSEMKTVNAPSTNGTPPTHKKSLPVRTF